MDFVTVDQRGPVTTISLNRPTLHNAFNDTMIEELISAFDAAESDARCRVVVLCAEGKNFSAGADLNWMKSMATLTHEENRQDALQLADLMHRIYRLPKVVIARVQGASYGGALGLITACDIAIADERARFCLSEVKIGLAPAVISPYVIEAMGLRQARRFMLSAEVFTAQQAVDMHVVHEAVPGDQLDQRVAELAATVAANGANAMAHCKALIQRVAHMEIGAETQRLTADTIADIRVSAEGQEGLAAFLGKREPSWRTVDQE